jgi:hypothetical protein
VAQDSTASPFVVDELTSNVNISNRNFACSDEEIVYRCKTRSTNNESFITEWSWNGTFLGKMFNSTDRIGHNNTCNTLLEFLHLTLVSAENDICVSLLIVRSSIPSYQSVINGNVTIACTAFGANGSNTSEYIQHDTVSGESCMCMCMLGYFIELQ